MTPQEQQMLMSLAQRVNQTQLQEKDPDAENLLGRELGANSDALYILAQTVLVQDIALQQAKAQVTQLQQQVQQRPEGTQPAHATSLLGSLFGRHDPQPAAPQAIQPMQPGQAPPYQPVPQYQQPQYQQPGQPQYYPPPPPQYAAAPYQAGTPYGAPVGQPSFLRGAMQTAAGVAAGALAFEGVESILHGFGHGGGYGGGFGGFGGGMSGMGMAGGFGRPVEETVVNNYYDSPGQGGAGGMMGGEHNFIPGGSEQHFHESADQGGGAHFSDAGYSTLGNDGGGYQLPDANNDTQGSDDTAQGGLDQSLADDSVAYDTSADDVQIDDGGGSFDDGGGGFDTGGGDNS